MLQQMALRGIKVLELAGLAPAPFCGMILSDFGATVIRVDKLTGNAPGGEEVSHGKYSLALNIKNPKGADIFKHLVKSSDVIIDPFRHGVMENLGLGPEDLKKINDKLIYARLTGYGQSGSMAPKAGHDINFVSLSGVLSMLGWGSKPTPSLNLLADFAGGGMTCALGIILALYERQSSGKGQVVDCSMTRGTSYLASWVIRSKNLLFHEPPGQNFLDGGCYFYDTYETKDGKWMAVGALEEKFYNDLISGLGLTLKELPYMSPTEKGREIFKNKFLEHTQEHWVKVFSGLDACVTPILTVQEAATNEHNSSQNTFVRAFEGQLVPTPEPRLSRTPGKSRIYAKPPKVGQHSFAVLREHGFSNNEIKAFADENLIYVCGQSKL